MRFSVTLLLDEIGSLLTSSPVLIAKYEQGDSDFPTAVFQWLGKAEQSLKKNDLPQVAAISAIKGKLLAAQNGIMETSDIMLVGPPQSQRKARMAVSAIYFSRGRDLLGGLHETMSQKRDEALKYIRQMVMLMEQQGALPSLESAGRSQALIRLFASMQSNPGSMAATRHVLMLVNYADALRLLDETLTEWGLEP
jgi:hypothetical protein